ncbi:MAG: ABC transporter ATP-binding protein [Leuconostoc pseudomesenteroides]|uniref:ABC transporter ATP-binding protein n=1 Tax=Leuconostoc pseudomesenteroides TaxID=33968 RepID=UPI001E3D7902|nr:ABC transporter ATP-binding protein [Leuconostoc pseudomesenteroides]MCC7668002.1 ABC transporter ATP-binding protein [Leuconostoc pseudomesenteroides]
MTLLKVEHLKKEYRGKFKNNTVTALADVNFEVEAGEFIAIMGESGSGKSTLLNCIATLDKPTTGKIMLNNEDLTTLSDKALASYRRDHLGFVFQDFNLLDTMSVRDNIYLPLVLANRTKNKAEKLHRLSEQLGIQDLLNKYPFELSGGQMQRVAIGRALITNPDILLGDEPTGALDSKNAAEILSLFRKYNESNQTILMVTHSALAASCAKRVLFIKDGMVFHQIYRGNRNDQEMLITINDATTNLFGGAR